MSDPGMGTVPKIKTEYFVKNDYYVFVRVWVEGFKTFSTEILIGSEPTTMRAEVEAKYRNRERA